MQGPLCGGAAGTLSMGMRVSRVGVSCCVLVVGLGASLLGDGLVLVRRWLLVGGNGDGGGVGCIDRQRQSRWMPLMPGGRSAYEVCHDAPVTLSVRHGRIAESGIHGVMRNMLRVDPWVLITTRKLREMGRGCDAAVEATQHSWVLDIGKLKNEE